MRNFATPSVDFACVHLWVDTWLYCDEPCKLRFLESWVSGHLEEAAGTFNKPVLLEEFGKKEPMAIRNGCVSVPVAHVLYVVRCACVCVCKCVECACVRVCFVSPRL